MSRSPLKAWADAQAASFWNRTERDLRRAWHGLLKGVFQVFQDDADLYVFLWGRSWSWIWPLIPLALAGASALALLGAWSFQIAHGLPAAGSWNRMPEGMTLLGLAMGLGSGVMGAARPPLAQPWPLRRSSAALLRFAGPFLHPACILCLMAGLVAAAPWVARRALFATALALLPLLAFRAGLAFSEFAKALRRPRVFRLAPDEGPEATLRRFFRQMAPREGGFFGRAGFVLALPLLFRGDFLLGLSVLGFWWAIVQADILRLEGRNASLMASFPISAATQVDARIRGVAAWSSPSAVIAFAVMGLGTGPLALLPGAMALLQMNLTGAALGLLASASAPLDGASLMSLQNLGLLTLCGGTASGWLATQALSDPSVLILQALAAGLAWVLLRRARGRVLGNWPWIQESLIRG